MEKSKRSLTVRMKHEDDYGMNEDSNLSRLEPDSVRASNKEDSQRTTTQTDNKRKTTKTKDLQCMKTHALASTTLTCSPSVSGHFTHCWDFRSRIPCRDSHCENGSFEVLSLHLPSVAADRRQLWAFRVNRESRSSEVLSKDGRQRVSPFYHVALHASSFIDYL